MRNAGRIAILATTRRGEAGTMGEILVLYYSRGGSVARLARQIARGIGE
ncbi:MAG: NAD(P)H-quinone oxidoreductase, partial [Lysobacteraceae bacterium]